MKLIFALGNPGTEYVQTRHNVGFAALDYFAAARQANFASKPKFFADIAEIQIAGEKVLLAEPTTYYNETGQSLRAIMGFYKIDSSDVLIIHDDLALPVGTMRTRVGGSGGGSNGIKSINAHGGEETTRLRIGIANEMREHITDRDFVLGRFSAEDSKTLEDIQPKISEIIEDFISGKLDITTHRQD